MPFVQGVMEDANVEFKSLSALAVTQGPGGFTGLRVGLATARALKVGLGIPLVGTSSFDLVRAATKLDQQTLVILDSRRKDFFTQEFSPNEYQGTAPKILKLDEIQGLLTKNPNLYLAGDDLSQIPTEFSDRFCHSVQGVSPIELVQAMATFLLPLHTAAPPEPLYLREPEISKPKKI